MKITGIKRRLLKGTMQFEGEFWEERLCRPVDIYEKYRAQGAHYLAKVGDNGYKMQSIFIEIETDAGISGLGGPISMDIADAARTLDGVLLGADPLANETLWDQMYRVAIHGRKGQTMMAISAIDCALWDIRGKWANAPVYKLLGGPTRDRIPAYASMLGFSVEPELVRARAKEYADKGYVAQKWFFRTSPSEGKAGLEKNVAMVKAAREGMGPDSDLMLDAWSSWDLRYAKMMAPRIADCDIRWLEEPAMADKPEICAQIRAAVPFPVSNGEHEYTRWGFKRLLDLQAQDVLQPDIYWAGGITETVKIATLASCYDVEVIPHGHQSHATAHFIAAMPPNLCPMQEFLIKWNTVHQFFIKDRLEPVDGWVTVPQVPGMGTEINEDLVEEEELLR